MRANPDRRNLLLIVVGVALLYGFATTLRYPSPWAEGDTSYFARTITSLVDHGSLDPADNPHIYPQGFAYQSWAGSLVLLSGVSVERFIGVLSPVLGSLLLAITALAAFTRLLRSGRAGFLATLTLFLVPEVMFSVLRGNHEKVTLAMTLLACLALASSLPGVQDRVRPQAWMIVYGLAITTAVATNVYFGSILVVALSLVLVATGPLVSVLPTLRASLRPLVPALTVAVTIGWGAVALMLLVIYPPAGHLLRVVPDVLAGLGSLFETATGGSFTPTSDPYASIRTDWVSSRVYQLLSLVRWILFFGSFGVWLAFCAQALRRADLRTPARLLALALYGAFGLILGLSIPIDLIGLDIGSNLQVRIYVYFAMFSAPIFALGVVASFGRIRRRWTRAPAAFALALLYVAFMAGGFLKAVNDPLVSNVWRFYAPTEVAAIDFYLERQPNRLRSLWIGPDNRLRDAYGVAYPATAVALMRFDATGITNSAAINLVSAGRLDAEYALDSHLMRQHGAVLAGVRTPASSLGSRVYDNGDTVITYLGREAWAGR